MRTWAVHNPSTYRLEIDAEDSIDIARHLSTKTVPEDLSGMTSHEIMQLLRFNPRRRKAGVGEIIVNRETGTQRYVGQQIDLARRRMGQELGIKMTDDNKHPLTDDIDTILFTSMSSNFPTAVSQIQLANRAGKRTVLGGIHASRCPDDVETYIRSRLEHPQLFSRVQGAADSTVMDELVHDLLSGTQKPEYIGHTCVEDNVWRDAELDGMGVNSGSLLHRIPYAGRVLRALSRVEPVSPFGGCPFKCDFCSIGNAPEDQKAMTKRSPDDFVGELEYFQMRGSRAFFFLPDNLLMGGKTLDAILDRIIKSDLKINFMAQASINIADRPEILKKLRQAGCTLIFVGLESLDLDNLREMDKGCVPAINRSGGDPRKYYEEKIRIIQGHGLSVYGAFIVGYPNDYFYSPHDHSGRDIADFCVGHDLGLQCTPLVDLPGAKQHSRSIAEGTHLYGKPGSMEYLLGLSHATNLDESNRTATDSTDPHSLPLSPLSITHMANDAMEQVNKVSNLMRAAWHAAKNAREHPVMDDVRTHVDKNIIDPLFAAAGQIMLLLNKCRGHQRDMGASFRRLYRFEENDQLREMFRQYAPRNLAGAPPFHMLY